MTNLQECGSGLDSEKAHDPNASKRPSSEWTFAEPIERVARFDVSTADVSQWLKKADYAVLGGFERR